MRTILDALLKKKYFEWYLFIRVFQHLEFFIINALTPRLNFHLSNSEKMTRDGPINDQELWDHPLLFFFVSFFPRVRTLRLQKHLHNVNAIQKLLKYSLLKHWLIDGAFKGKYHHRVLQG